MTNADLRYAKLVGADLSGANCTNAKFEKAIIDSAVFQGCKNLNTSGSVKEFLTYQSDLNKKISDYKQVLARSGGATVGNTLSLVEIMLLRNGESDRIHAGRLLSSIREVSRFDTSAYLYFSLLYSIIAKSDNESRRAVDFVNGFEKINLWEWETWKNCFYPGFYSRIQVRKIVLISLVAQQILPLEALTDIYDISVPVKTSYDAKSVVNDDFRKK